MSARAGRGVVRLPAVLEGYGCGRTLVCCRAPWRAVLGEGEAEAIAARLAARPRAKATYGSGPAGAAEGAAPLPRGSESAARRFAAALEAAEGAPAVLAQRDGACALLDPPGPRGVGDRRALGSCALQHAAGLAALPALCRSFPRSVVATPRGIEVAFLLACPTAAAMVVAGARPFAWVERPRAGWRYGPVAEQGPDVAWDDDGAIGFGELGALRGRWWAAIDAAGEDASGRALLEALVGLARTPEAPGASAGADLDELAHTLDGSLADELAHALGGLPGSGPAHAARREALAEALAAPCPVAELTLSAAAAPRVWACALGLTAQFAGVHTDVPARVGLHAAAWEGALALLIHAALRRVDAVSPREALRDALTVASQLGCASLTPLTALLEPPACG